MSRIVAVTQHPASSAHGVMAAAALAKVSEVWGHTVQMECCHGQPWSSEAVKRADVVLLVSDRVEEVVDFGERPFFGTTTSRAICDTEAVLGHALACIDTSHRLAQNGHANGHRVHTLHILLADDVTQEARAFYETMVEGREVTYARAPTFLSRTLCTSVASGRVLSGVAASPGVAVGKLFYRCRRRIVARDAPSEPSVEEARLRRAVCLAHEQLEQCYCELAQRVGKAQAAIFRVHRALLDDEELFADVLTAIGAGHAAAWAFECAIERRVRELAELDDECLAARADDLRDVAQRVLSLLLAPAPRDLGDPGEPCVLVAKELCPSDIAELDPQRVLGLCTALGGPTSHAAILARTLDIPAVVGVGDEVLALHTDGECILDGAAGKLYVEPGEHDLAVARAHRSLLDDLRARYERARFEPAIMTCGHRVEVVANIANAREARDAVRAGAEGVGLVRSEFLFLGREAPPSEDEQFAAYEAMLRALSGLPLIIRTLDAGGDKALPYLALPREQNPSLGMRGLRLCLARPELFVPQLRAIYRLARIGPVKVLFPMVATLEELRRARELSEAVRRELGAPYVELGVMVEVPSVVMLADAFAEEVDFFSVGTNDLTQFVFAIDRDHPVLCSQSDSLHPAVLRMVDMTVRAAEHAGKRVGVCGGVASDPFGALILVGLGVRELSVALPSLAAVKAQLRSASLTDARALASQALACRTGAEVRALCADRS